MPIQPGCIGGSSKASVIYNLKLVLQGGKGRRRGMHPTLPNYSVSTTSGMEPQDAFGQGL